MLALELDGPPVDPADAAHRFKSASVHVVLLKPPWLLLMDLVPD